MLLRLDVRDMPTALDNGGLVSSMSFVCVCSRGSRGMHGISYILDKLKLHMNRNDISIWTWTKLLMTNKLPKHHGIPFEQVFWPSWTFKKLWGFLLWGVRILHVRLDPACEAWGSYIWDSIQHVRHENPACEAWESCMWGMRILHVRLDSACEARSCMWGMRILHVMLDLACEAWESCMWGSILHVRLDPACEARSYVRHENPECEAWEFCMWGSILHVRHENPACETRSYMWGMRILHVRLDPTCEAESCMWGLILHVRHENPACEARSCRWSCSILYISIWNWLFWNWQWLSMYYNLCIALYTLQIYLIQYMHTVEADLQK